MKQNEFLKKDGFAYGVRRFLSGRLYLVLFLLCVFLGHALALEIPFLLFLMLPTLLGFLFCEDLRFLIPLLLGGVCIISVKNTPYIPSESDYLFTVGLPYLIAFVLLFVFGLAVFLVRRRRFAAPFSSLRLKWGFLGFFAAMVLSGLFQENALQNVVYGVGVGASFLAVYLLFGFFHPKTKENAHHFLFALLFVGLLVSFELLLLYFRTVEFENGMPVKSSVLIGWGTWTHIGAMLGMCLPAPFYFARTEKRGYPLYLLSGGIMTVALLFSASRASWLYGGVILALSLLLLCLGGVHRKASRIGICVLFALGVLGVILLLPKIMAFLSAFVQFGAGDNGRFEIYAAAIRAFRAAPIFGRGFFNTDIVLDGFPPIMPYLYHNTPLQMLGSAGAVGFLLYAYHRFETVRLLFAKRQSPLSLFLLLVPIALVLFSITDEHIFHVYPAFFYAIALSLAEGRYTDAEAPLFEK